MTAAQQVMDAAAAAAAVSTEPAVGRCVRNVLTSMPPMTVQRVMDAFEEQLRLRRLSLLGRPVVPLLCDGGIAGQSRGYEVRKIMHDKICAT